MTLKAVVELILAAGAAFLLARDVRRAWRDRLRRPMTLLITGLIAALLIGVVGGQRYPSPWWLTIPAAILAWEAGRGWRLVPRCHVWEAGVGTFAAALLVAALGLGLAEESLATALLAISAATGIVAVALLWTSRRREPPAWRAADPSHYERRATPR
jgi:hypothetical protein